MKRLLCALLIMVLSMTFYSSSAIEEKAQSYDYKYTYTPGTPDPFESQNDNGLDFKSMKLLHTNATMIIQMNHNIHVQYDVDVLGFPVYKTADCEIKLYDIPEYCDYDLELYSANYTSHYLARSVNGKNYDELIEMTLEPGFYFVRIYSYMGYSNTPYSIKISRPLG